MAVQLTQAEQDAVLRSRLAVPERALRSLMKRLTSVAAPLPSNEGASSSVSIEDTTMADVSEEAATEDVELRATQLIALKTDLAAYVASLIRSSKVARNTCTAEVESYEEEAHQIQEEHEADTKRIEELKRELEEARRERGNKLLYDQVVERMGKMDSRKGYAESLASLRAQIVTLEKRNERLSTLSKSSKDQFENIVSQMNSLGESLRGVKTSGALGSDEEEIESDSESSAASDAGEGPEDPSSGPTNSKAGAVLGSKRSLNPAATSFTPARPASSSSASGERKRANAESGESRSARRAGTTSAVVDDARKRRRGGTSTPLAASTRATSVEEGEEEEGAV
ncbi:hypothetical protein IE81DRAFT_323322 [Ceraceosorus guamensis]|uniref:Uncharacterized protein n=1 Tax=Ceraceosorus guamensis TaxID=1522189 RepID=A0A316VYN6_9BASI|nr:hypothetical protein IE81DRAFT_323322 [Ceraceosorus guamensis]PWN42562.1 hypothetical protein IE81DRAFT_323322 [Ceraceosorus guamensis]